MHSSQTSKPKCEDDAAQGSEHAASSLPVRFLSMIDHRLAAPRRERISLFRGATCSGGTTHGKRKAINRKWEGVYQADANFQISQMNGKHPMRKVLHMQSFYPATIRRLSDKLSTISNVAPDGTKHTDSRDPKAKAAVSSASGRGPRHLPSSSNSSKNKAYFSPTTASAALATVAPSQERSLLTTGRSSRSGSTSRLASIKRCSRESREMRRRATQEEYSFCHGKMRYNRARGRGAEVNGIITGNAPLEVKMPLFPARATHQQLLGLVHRPSHPDKPAPEVPRERKWLGDSVGWEGEKNDRALPRTRRVFLFIPFFLLRFCHELLRIICYE